MTFRYTSYKGYKPPKEEPEYCGMFSSIYIKDASNAIFTANDFYYSFFLYAKIKNGEFTGDSLNNTVKKYKTYSYGDDLYMFVQFINGDGEHTYVFKKEEPAKKIKIITDISKFEGNWTGIDFIGNTDFECIDLYSPNLKFWGDTLFYKSADIKDGKIKIKFSDNSDSGYLKIGKNDINGSKYAVYEINNEMYLFIEFVNGDGNNIYVLKKD